MHATSFFSFPDALSAEFERLRREMDSLFQATGFAPSIRSGAPGTFPALNIGTTPTSVEVHAYAPGIDPSKIELTLDRGVLTIAGERAPDVPDGDARTTVYSRERFSGRFRRAVSLPQDIDPSQVAATYRDGVLRVSIARKGPAQPRRITVQ